MFQPVWQVFLSALLVWRMYANMKYYPATAVGCCKAVYGYMLELIKLRGSVLTEFSGETVVGTLMCSKVGLIRNPADRIFPWRMRCLRAKYGRKLAYFGKFAVLSFPDEEVRGDTTIVRQLLTKAVTDWAFAHQVTAVVMLINPNQANFYFRLGAKVLGKVQKVHGLDKAPAVLLYLDLEKSKRLSKLREAYRAQGKA